MDDKTKRVRWTDSEIEILTKIYPNTSNKDISVQINRSEASISTRAYLMRLKKSNALKSKLIGYRNKMVGRNLTFEIVKEIASKYKTRGEFLTKDSSAYQTARRHGYLSDICQHMAVMNFSIPQLILQDIMDGLLKSSSLYNTRRIIPPYEIDIYYPEFKLAFEYNGSGWHSDNPRDEIKMKLFEKNNIHIIYIVENNRKYDDDIKSQLIQRLDAINHICHTNISPENIKNYHASNVYSKLYNKEELLMVAHKYTSFSTFKLNESNIYRKLSKLNLLDVATSHMKDRRKRYTPSEVEVIANKYTILKEFIQHEFPIYQFISRNKLWNLIDHMKSNHRWKSTLST